MRPPPWRAAALWFVHLLAFAAVTAGLFLRRSPATQVQAVLAYLLIILSASALTQRILGFTLAVLAVILIDFTFQSPFGRLGADGVFDLLVLLAFFAVAIVTTQLLVRARERTEEAEQRSREMAALAEERIELITAAAESRRQAAVERVRTQVLGGISHDLRTPLTTIRALAQDAARSGVAIGVAIDEQAARLEQHVNNMLDLARMRSHTFTVVPVMNAVEDLFGALVRQVRGTLGTRQIRLHVDMQGPPLLVCCDFVQTLRALGNVVDNAIRVTPADGTIDIGTELAGEFRVALWVGDRGPGIPDDEAARIYQPFYRPPSAPADGARAGLGLAVAMELLQQQDGTLAHAPRAGGGTLFTIVLPRAVEGDVVLDGAT